MYVEIEAWGEDVFARDLMRFRERAVDMSPAFHAIADSFLGIEKRQFGTQGQFSGGWRPLASSTLAEKLRLGLDPRILHRTLRLRQSLTSPSHGDHIRRITPDEMFVGSAVPYGVYHQSSRPRRHLPRRPPVALTENHKRRWIKILQSWLVEGEAHRTGGE